MTDSSLDIAEGTPTEAGGGADVSSLPLEDVRELFVTLGKALRAFQLYDDNNPVYHRFVSALGDAFRNVWTEMDRLQVQVTESSLVLEGEMVYRTESRSDSLAFLLFKDGIRDVTFLPGIEEDELTRFLGVLQRARNVRPEGDDLLTILWEEDLQYFRHHYVDLLAEGVELPQSGDGNTREDFQEVLDSEDAPRAAATRAEPESDRTIQREDFNPTLYSLDPREMEELRREIDREMQRDLRADVVSALFDRLEEPDEPERQSEVLGVFHQLLPNLLSRGELTAARDVLAQLRELESRDGVFDPPRQAEVAELLDSMSAPETMEELIRSLEDGSIRPTPAELSGFLAYLRGRALSSLLRAAETTQVKELQPILREAVRGIAERNQNALVGLLDDPDPQVVAGAARLVGRMQVTEAGAALGDLMFHDDPAVRLAAVEAARDLKVSTAAGALIDALYDSDRDVRMAAARALGQLQYRPAEDAFASIIDGKDIRNTDLSEKIAFFESYGAVAGEDAVPLLDKLLNHRGFLGRREPAEVRACAALALGKIGSGAARDSLEEASSEEDPVVRSAVNRALRGDEA